MSQPIKPAKESGMRKVTVFRGSESGVSTVGRVEMCDEKAKVMLGDLLPPKGESREYYIVPAASAVEFEIGCVDGEFVEDHIPDTGKKVEESEVDEEGIRGSDGKPITDEELEFALNTIFDEIEKEIEPENETSVEKHKFTEHLKNASKVVSDWPEWKKHALGGFIFQQESEPVKQSVGERAVERLREFTEGLEADEPIAMIAADAI